MTWGRKTKTEWGYRFGNKDVWVGSKSEAESAIKRMKKSVKKGATPPKLIQRQVPAGRAPAKTRLGQKLKDKVPELPKNTCRGGKCNKRGNICKKHFQDLSANSRGRNGKLQSNEWSLDNIHKRWDEEGHRWS